MIREKQPREFALIGDNTREDLRRTVYRIEVLLAKIYGLKEDIRETKKAAKAGGLDIKALNRVLRERLMDPDDLEIELANADAYRRALGILADTPLGQAAVEVATKIKPRSKKTGHSTPPASPDDELAEAV